MQYEETKDGNLLRVFEHNWKTAIANFQTGAFVHKKFAQ